MKKIIEATLNIQINLLMQQKGPVTVSFQTGLITLKKQNIYSYSSA